MRIGRPIGRTLGLGGGLLLAASLLVSTATTASAEVAATPIALNVTAAAGAAQIHGERQGFSVESADLAHGFLTSDLLAQRLRTLGKTGTLRIGGYSMDLVWPAFGAYAGTPAPPLAIGGTVDQADLDGLKKLLRDTGWKATIGAPLKTLIDPAKVKDASKDPSPQLEFAQVVAEVTAVSDTLGRDLLAVEVGNEYDNVTTLSGAEMWTEMKRYHDAIQAAVPRARLKMVGPSANTAKVDTRLSEFVAAVEADTATEPGAVLSELASHWYPGSHCGTSNATLATLMSPVTHTNAADRLRGIMEVSSRLGDRIPMTMNETNSVACSGQPGVSDAYGMALWALDYQLLTAQAGVVGLQMHTNTAAICGDFQPRLSATYPISYRYYGAFCAADQAALDAKQLSASPLYYGVWAFRQLPEGPFLDVDLADADLAALRAYAVAGPRGSVTVVLINVQDPAAAASTSDAVTLTLPGSYRSASAQTLTSSAAGGLASTEAAAVSLGGRTVTGSGAPSGRAKPTPVAVDGSSSTVTVAPGTAQIITYSPHR